MHIPHIQCKSHWKNTKVQIRAKMWLSYEWVFGFNALKLIEMHRVLRPSETGLFLWVFSFSWSFRPSPASTFPPFGPFTLASLLCFFFVRWLFVLICMARDVHCMHKMISLRKPCTYFVLIDWIVASHHFKCENMWQHKSIHHADFIDSIEDSEWKSSRKWRQSTRQHLSASNISLYLLNMFHLLPPYHHRHTQHIYIDFIIPLAFPLHNL